MTKHIIKPALIYIRIASIREIDIGKQIFSQEMRCKDYADKNGFTVLDTYYDLGVSGNTKLQDRVGGQELLLSLETHGSGTAVIVADIARIARDTLVFFSSKRAIASRGGQLISLSQNLNDLAPEGKLFETIQSAFVGMEREKNRSRVLNRMAAYLEEGYWCIGSTPLGYIRSNDSSVGHVLKLDDYNATLVKVALEKLALGKLERISDVQHYLNEMGIKGSCGKNRGKKIHCSYKRAKTICHNAGFYAGYIEYMPWGVSRRKGKHPALISMATYQKIVDRLAAHIPSN